LSSTGLDFRQLPIVQFCQGEYPTKIQILAIVETQDKLRQLAEQVACSAGGLQCRWLENQMMYKVRAIKSNDDGIDNFIFSD
jgi:hypothetical protein